MCVCNFHSSAKKNILKFNFTLNYLSFYLINNIDVNKKAEIKAVTDKVVDFDEALAKLGNTRVFIQN